MDDKELDRIAFQSHGQDARAIEYLRTQLAERTRERDEARERLTALRDEIPARFYEWKGIDYPTEQPCKDCGGSGERVYASTTAWRGGIGGCAMTRGVCDKCWGSGVAERPWTNLRALSNKDRRIAELERVIGRRKTRPSTYTKTTGK